MKDKTAPTICGLYLEISTLCLMLDRFIKFHFMKVTSFWLRSTFLLTLPLAVFCSNDITRSVSDHQTFLSIIWYNFLHHGLEWPELDTLFSKNILFNKFSCTSHRMATVSGDVNVAPTDLESSSSKSSAKTPNRVRTSGLKWPTKWSGGWWSRPTSKQDYTFWTER